jgi:ornithine carbamoyltransferase
MRASLLSALPAVRRPAAPAAPAARLLARASSSAPAPAPGSSVDASSLRGRHLDSLLSLSARELRALLNISHGLRRRLAHAPAAYRPLAGRSMAMIFQKRSTRTRVSTEAGFAQLGGHALFLGSEDIQLGKNETLADTAQVLSRYNDIILARVYGHADIDALCAHARVPVINALSDAQHPLQGLADLMTIEQRFGRAEGLTVAWVGDGNNIANTFLSAAPRAGFNLRLATPRGYEPPAALLRRAEAEAAGAGVSVTSTHDPLEAVRGAHVVVTDTWVSMGMEAEDARRKADFAGFQVTEALCRRGGAHADWVFLHCLPRKPEEVDDEVFFSPRSLVFDEAENRKWTVMAATLALLLGGADV